MTIGPHSQMQSQQKRIRDYGIELGVLSTGPLNAITDVPGVRVGHSTMISGDSVRTGVTAILPHPGNLFQQKVPAAIYIGNGFGKLAGYSQVDELGNLETPIILTNTLSVPVAMNALITYTLGQPGNEQVFSVNAVVGETNDGRLNDIRGRHITEEHVLEAIKKAGSGPVAEGNVGAGTGTMAFGYKGGIGTASRVTPEKAGGYTVGVLVQANFGGILTLNGQNLANLLDKVPSSFKEDTDGSCMMVVLTDAPLDVRNLKRLAKRAMLGLARTGGIASNGSGDYVIAVSTAVENRISYVSAGVTTQTKSVHNDHMSPLFLAAVEATEEAIWNALFMAEEMMGYKGRKVEALPVEKIIDLVRK
ncbi:DmpA family aminopeptidase [Robiginitalea sp. IMCC43444]|uniref:DmpA family aminopeptidase n=1 Tax=Robiginitalea sp. IMCC43444 TaxID=3459121 RepID=UPI004041E396